MMRILKAANYVVPLIGIAIALPYACTDQFGTDLKANEKKEGVTAPPETEIHLPYGLPLGTPVSNDLVCRSIYCLSSNDTTKFADWVAYQLDERAITGDGEQSRLWEADPDIAEPETLEPNDYRGVGKLKYDRGHQMPLASARGGNWQLTNLLSNITPQKASLNRGAWVQLEKAERGFVKKGGAVWIITGPLYEREMQPLPNADEPHRVPSGYWKVLWDGNKMHAYAFEQETPTGYDYRLGLTSVDEIERRSGLDLFPAMPQDRQQRLEREQNQLF